MTGQSSTIELFRAADLTPKSNPVEKQTRDFETELLLNPH